MKKIVEYRKLLDVTKAATLKELKTIYRNSMKECHPDTCTTDEEQLAAEDKSKAIIEAYHFLVSIAPETAEKNLSEYTKTTTGSGILEFYYENQALYINFVDGSSYEYFGVPKAVYIKMGTIAYKGKQFGVFAIFRLQHDHGQFRQYGGALALNLA